jgi:hypothetical protein
MSLVVGLFLELPEEGLHGFAAAYGIALSDESRLVGIDLGQVLRAVLDR